MKKLLFVLAAVFLAVSYAYAQSARNAAYNHEGKSNFSDISVQGLDVSGNPGYIELRAAKNQTTSADAPNTYYLWVDNTGDLCMASYTTISAYASFPTGDWSGHTGDNSHMPCTKVGSQS